MQENPQLLPTKTIVEQECQKTLKLHGITQRPDIILHIPMESGISSNRIHNNYYVIALKLKAKKENAIEDFKKLDEMFEKLNYPEGVFVNLGGYPNSYLQEYSGNYKERIHEISIGYQSGKVLLKHIRFDEKGIIELSDY